MADTFIYVMEGPNASDDATRAEVAAAASLANKVSAETAASTATSAMEVAQASATTATTKASEASDSADAAASSEAVALAAQQASLSSQQAAALSEGNSAASAAVAQTQADRASTFVGGNWPLPHSHVTGPIAVDPEYARLSDAYDRLGKRYEYNQRIWDSTYGTEVWEGTTNLLPAGSENFVTGWTNNSGCTITDYPVYIAGVGYVVAKRIQSTSNTTTDKLVAIMSNRTSGGIATVSLYGMVLSGNCNIRAQYVNPVSLTATMQKVSTTNTGNVNGITLYFSIMTAAASDVLDVVVYQPQAENKPYATPYTPPGTTRAAASLAIPVGAYQKNLLTLNQATGGDTLGDTTGFTKFRNTETVSRDVSAAWNGTGNIKVVTPGEAASEGINVTNDTFKLTVGKIYTATLYAWGEGTVLLGANNIALSVITPVVLSGTKQRLSYTFVATTVSTNGPCLITNSAQAATFYVDGLQLEEGTTASDFALPAVDYTNAIIDPAQPFSIEFDAVPWVDDKSANKYLFGFGDSSSFFTVYSIAPSGRYGVSQRYLGGTVGGALSTVVAVAGTKASHKISVSGSQFIYSLNGVDIGIGTFAGLPSLFNVLMYFGALYDGTAHRNGYISNVRIRKGVALTAAERAYTGQLVADQYTTFASNLKETISSRPFVKVNGVGQNVVLAGDSPNQNAIVNGDFRLASRGTSFSNPASGSKLLDGWTIGYNGTGQTFTVSQESFLSGQQEVSGAENFLRINQTVAPTGQTTFYVIFKIENAKKFEGKRCNIIITARSTAGISLPNILIAQSFGTGGSPSGDVTALISGAVKTGQKFAEIVIPFNMPSTAGKVFGSNSDNKVYGYIYFPINTAFQLDIADVDIKPVDMPQKYYRRDIQMLQQLGARTLQKLPANLQLRAVNVQANYIDFESVVLPVEMRAAPALTGTYAETTNWKVLSTAAVQTTGFSWALLNASANQVAFRATKTSHGLTDATLQLVTNVLLSAEL